MPTVKRNTTKPITKTSYPKKQINDMLTVTPVSDKPMDPRLLAVLNTKMPVSEDKLDKIRAQCRFMRVLMLQIKEDEALLAERKKILNKMSMETLPELFAENNISSITIGAVGNLPEMTLENKPFYKAVLPADSDAGLRWLEKNGHGDLIKRVFDVRLPMNSKKQADKLRKFVQQLDLAYEEKETVPWTTLTAFVKEMIEKRKKAVPLDILGAMIGRVVKIKQERSDK